jgi:hypothetical protein
VFRWAGPHPHGARRGDEVVLWALRPLLDLPVEIVLPAHGEPVLANGRAALASALG